MRIMTIAVLQLVLPAAVFAQNPGERKGWGHGYAGFRLDLLQYRPPCREAPKKGDPCTLPRFGTPRRCRQLRSPHVSLFRHPVQR